MHGVCKIIPENDILLCPRGEFEVDEAGLSASPNDIVTLTP